MKLIKLSVAALATLTLLASCNKEPKKEVHQLVVRICDTELRAIEKQISKTDDKDPEGLIMTDVNIVVNDKDLYKLESSDIEKAKQESGHTIMVRGSVDKVTMTANGVVDDKEITVFQSLGDEFLKKVPLVAEAKETGSGENKIETVPSTSTDDKTITYKAVLVPTPKLARLEVFGKIEGQKNEKNKSAYKSIEVEEVYMNNYLEKGGKADRYMTPGDGKSGFDQTSKTLKPQMKDAITAECKDAFVKGGKCAAYQLFPITDTEAKMTEDKMPKECFDHVILKLKIKYDKEVAKNKLVEEETLYVTMIRFMENATKDLKGFQAGTIYKLDLKELSKDFKTDEDGNPDNPATPDPEPTGKNKLIVIVKPYKWQIKNIKPDVNGGGYKK